ncbi:hypothetical protein HDK77DRAFT_441510 [Phyllosticta capitalensis]|uniref:uncharacterized protein n=1 Tax=Phyllosticta capitalensis TaxID=121624 RepID=UPI00312F2558
MPVYWWPFYFGQPLAKPCEPAKNWRSLPPAWLRFVVESRPAFGTLAGPREQPLMCAACRIPWTDCHGANVRRRKHHDCSQQTPHAYDPGNLSLLLAADCVFESFIIHDSVDKPAIPRSLQSCLTLRLQSEEIVSPHALNVPTSRWPALHASWWCPGVCLKPVVGLSPSSKDLLIATPTRRQGKGNRPKRFPVRAFVFTLALHSLVRNLQDLSQV